jgi:isoquinoline 1-oxidoreductase subunit alpha
LDLRINGSVHAVDIAEDTPLLWVLRDVLGLTGTKFGCGIAQCGACTVMIDGVATRSCVLSISALADREVTTIEWIDKSPIGRKVQEAWLIEEVVQCGYCQSGQVVAATSLLSRVANPTDEQIDEAMAGNICRCGTYVRIREAIHNAAAA